MFVIRSLYEETKLIKWIALYRGNLNSQFFNFGLMAIPRKPMVYPSIGMA